MTKEELLKKKGDKKYVKWVKGYDESLNPNEAYLVGEICDDYVRFNGDRYSQYLSDVNKSFIFITDKKANELGIVE